MIVPQDVIIQSSGNGRWILYNVFTQNTLAVSSDSLAILEKIDADIKTDEITDKNKDKTFFVWQIERFSNYDGLLADPTRRIREFSEWPEPVQCSIIDLIKIFEKNFFVIDDYEKYLKIFASKNSLLDNEHIGNFHQQLGQKLLVEKKQDPDKWWIAQKFNSNYDDLNDNLYKSVQEHFLKKIFKKKFNESHTILDLGCGIGYYSRKIADTGANVIAVDPNEKFIEIAKKHSQKNVSYHLSEIGKKNSLDWIEPTSIDFVFMSDALLFYFVSPNPKQKFGIDDLFFSIRRVLKKEGRFLSLEPHGIFFLRPWLGEKSKPFTIITEYNTKLYNITPKISEFVCSFIKNGFVIRDMAELNVDEDFIKNDPRGSNFAKEFPLWWFFELEPEK